MILLIIFLSQICSAETAFKERPDKPSYHQCIKCHRTKKVEFIPEKHQPERYHSTIYLLHGKKEMSCNFCHDKKNHNLLMQYEDVPTTFVAPSGVCSQCHADIYKSLLRGIHGKRMGGWMGERVQYHCTECHNAHSVPFAKMKALPPPARNKLGISKVGEE